MKILKNYYTEEEFYVICSIQIYPIFLVRIITEVWSTISPIYQWENFNEILIIIGNIMVNIFIVENWSQIVHIEDHLKFYNSKLKSVRILTLDRPIIIVFFSEVFIIKVTHLLLKFAMNMAQIFVTLYNKMESIKSWFDHRCGLAVHRYGLAVNVVASHPAGPGLILGRAKFLVEVFSGVFPQL